MPHGIPKDETIIEAARFFYQRFLLDLIKENNGESFPFSVPRIVEKISLAPFVKLSSLVYYFSRTYPIQRIASLYPDGANKTEISFLVNISDEAQSLSEKIADINQDLLIDYIMQEKRNDKSPYIAKDSNGKTIGKGFRKIGVVKMGAIKTCRISMYELQDVGVRSIRDIE